MVLDHLDDVELKEIYGRPPKTTTSRLGQPVSPLNIRKSKADASGSGLRGDFVFPDSSASMRENSDLEMTDAEYEEARAKCKGKGKDKAVEDDTRSTAKILDDLEMSITPAPPLNNDDVPRPKKRARCVACGLKPCLDCPTSSTKSRKSNSTGRTQVDEEANTTPGEAPTTLAILNMVRSSARNHPIHWHASKKWSTAFMYCLLQVFVTLTSTSYLGIQQEIMSTFQVTKQVSTLGQSLYIMGNAVGPAFLGPLSDIKGRKWVYVASMAVFGALNMVNAMAFSFPVLAVFMFLSGVAASTAVTNVAGSIADMFGDREHSTLALGLFVVSANVGPAIGAPMGYWVSRTSPVLPFPAGMLWLFMLNTLIAFCFIIPLMLLPETLPRMVIINASKKDERPDHNAIQILETTINVEAELRFITKLTFKLLFTEPIVYFLGIYNGFSYGLMFLYLDGVYDVFVINNHWTILNADLTYLNFLVGVLIMFAFIPVQEYLYRRDRAIRGGRRPEARFITSCFTVWLFPISLLWFAFTSDGHRSAWLPIVAGTILGFANPLLWLAMLTYLTDTYPNCVGTAIAAFFIPSFLVAAGLAHAGHRMFQHLGTTWAMATLGFVSVTVGVLVLVMYFCGHHLRKRSSCAQQF